MSRMIRSAVALVAIAVGAAVAARAATSFEPSNPDRCDLTRPYAVLHEFPAGSENFAQGFHLIVCDTVPAFAFSAVPDRQVRSISVSNGAVVALTEYPENHPAFPGRLMVAATNVGDLAPYGLAANASSAWFYPMGSRVVDPSGIYALRFDTGGKKVNGLTVLRSLVDSGRVSVTAKIESP